MENNKILIGVIFSEEDWKVQFELSVLHDMLLKDLFSGIVNGIHNIPGITDEDKERCINIHKRCFDEENYLKTRDHGYFFDGITLSSYLQNETRLNNRIAGHPYRFFLSDLDSTLTDLGFISSSVLIFGDSGSTVNEVGSYSVIKEFTSDMQEDLWLRPEKTIEFPEYNISTRKMIYYDDSPEKIISPGDAPQKPQISLLTGIFPVLSSVILLAGRSLNGDSFSWSNSSAFTIITIAVGVIGSIVTAFKQRKDYKRSLSEWKNRYQDYIAGKIKNIKDRQRNYSQYLGEKYPSLNSKGANSSIPIITADVYSRHPEDDDFLSVMLGVSKDVKTPFEIQGEKAERVYSDSFFRWRDSSRSSVDIFIRDEIEKDAPEGETLYNLSELPGIVAEEYRFQNELTEYIYPVGKKGAVGIVGNSFARERLIDSIVLDLCYYQSPDNLQMIMLFNKVSEYNSEEMEQRTANYKYLPHFRELFNGLSQFVFDQTSANLVFGNVLQILSERRTARRPEGEGNAKLTPHIMFIVIDGEDYGLKEHALSEFLPDPPRKGEQYVNDIGCTFIYGAYTKEYLPSFCNDVLNVSMKAPGQVSRNNVITEIELEEYQNTASDFTWGLSNSVRKVSVSDPSNRGDVSKIYGMLSAIYYSRMAQNSRIPSSVSLFDLWKDIPKGSSQTSFMSDLYET